MKKKITPYIKTAHLSLTQRTIFVLGGSICMYVLSVVFQLLHFPFIFSLFAIILGGIFVGHSIKKSGWIYAIVATVVLTLFVILLNLTGVITTKEVIFQNAGFNSVMKNLRFLPFNILLGGIGGFLGEKLSQNTYKNNK